MRLDGRKGLECFETYASSDQMVGTPKQSQIIICRKRYYPNLMDIAGSSCLGLYWFVIHASPIEEEDVGGACKILVNLIGFIDC